MQRHGNNDIGFIHQGAAATQQPARKAWNMIETIGMLEREDRPFAPIVVAHDGARRVEYWRARVTSRAKCSLTRIEFKWQPATCTARPVEELDFLPAVGA